MFEPKDVKQKTRTQATETHTSYIHLHFGTQNAKTQYQNEEQNGKRCISKRDQQTQENASCLKRETQQSKTLILASKTQHARTPPRIMYQLVLWTCKVYRTRIVCEESRAK